jgi:protein-tyrosine-phosphatase
MTLSTRNVLFLCTHNSARSILAEALLNHIAQGASGTHFKAFSAGSHPRENQQPHPLAIRVLQAAGIATDDLRSKNWDEFAKPEAPHMDLVITVCDNAAGEACPYWPGQPATAHWGYPDPSAAQGSEEERLTAFRHTLDLMQKRLQLLVDLPAEKLQKNRLQVTAHELSQGHV